MSAAPRIPKEQRSFADRGSAGVDEASLEDRRDPRTGFRSGQPGDADVNPGQQGRYGNLKQNLTNRWQVQDR